MLVIKQWKEASECHIYVYTYTLIQNKNGREESRNCMRNTWNWLVLNINKMMTAYFTHSFLVNVPSNSVRGGMQNPIGKFKERTTVSLNESSRRGRPLETIYKCPWLRAEADKKAKVRWLGSLATVGEVGTGDAERWGEFACKTRSGKNIS